MIDELFAKKHLRTAQNLQHLGFRAWEHRDDGLALMLIPAAIRESIFKFIGKDRRV